MSINYNIIKKDSKLQNQRFSSAKQLHKLNSNYNSFLSPTCTSSFISTRNKTKTLITSVLSTSKRFIIKGRRPLSTNNILDNMRYEYPYKPDLLLKLKDHSNKKNLLFSDELNILTRNFKPKQSDKPSLESSLSSLRSSSNNTGKSNLIFNKSSHKKIKFNLISQRSRVLQIKKNKILIDDDNSNKNNKEDNKFNITEEKFLNYIDFISIDKKYIYKYKNKFREYFDNDNFKKEDSYFLRDLIDTYQYKEKEDENYFIKNIQSTKKKNFIIKDLNISLKLSSLRLIFYEIKESNEDNKSNNNTKNGNYILNTKINFPFEFLAIFYGLNFDEFIILLLSLIDYDFSENKFFIDYDNFINRINDCKILYDFFTEKSFAFTYNSNNSKEYFSYNWDVKGNDKEIKKYFMKILLPRITMKINFADKNKIKFYSSINIKAMNNLFKNSFNNWDFFVFLYFSEIRLFRFEINKIISGKYSNNESIKNRSFNLTNSITKINTMKKDNKTQGFFYTFINEDKSLNYFINFKFPEISISLDSFTKNFSIDFRRFYHLNKLRKYFFPEHLIKYSMTIKKGKNKIIQKEEEEKEKRSVKNFITSKTMRPLKRSFSKLNSGKKLNFKRFYKNKMKNEIRGSNQQIQKKENNKEVIKDIELNLDKYIFNYDETILKFINKKDIYKEYFESNNDNNYEYNNNYLDNKKLNINIGTLELSWMDKDGMKNNYKFDKKISQYLFKFPPIKWRLYVENNINSIISGASKRNALSKKISFFQKKK